MSYDLDLEDHRGTCVMYILDDSQEPGHVPSVGFDGHTCCYLVLMPPATSLPCQMLGLGGDKSDEAAAIL